jgi:toxin ParE1/3/4
MSRYVIAPNAREDLAAIWDYIALEKDRPLAARRQLQRLRDRFATLAANPLLGEVRDDLRAGLRVFSADRYVICYDPIEDGVEIVAVLHGARDIESIFRRGER